MIIVLALYKGNPDAFAPTDTSLYAKAMKGNVPSTFLSKARVFAVPESPDLIVTGDFNRDGYKDVLVAARGGSLYFLAGDGKGNLTDSMERPTAKCRDGTYWGQTPSGDPICVWGH